MLVKASKEVTDRQKAFVFLHSVLTLQGPVVAQALAALRQPASREGEAPADEPGFLTVILEFGQMLKERLAQLLAVDETHLAAKGTYNAVLQRRDDLSRQLTRLVVALRRAVLGHHETPELYRIGLEGETAREPVPVLRLADRIVEALASGDFEKRLGEPIFDGCPFEPKDRGLQLQAKADELREVLDKVGGAKRRAEDAFLKKEEAAKVYDQLFTRAARTFEDWCRLVGRNDLADRIRPSARRLGQTEQESTEASEDTAQAASEETLPEAPAEQPSEDAAGAGESPAES